MKKISWEIRFGILLVSISSILYLIHFVVYKDIGDILLKSLAFLPISILFVALIVNRLLIQRGKKISLEKLNLLIGIFFSEVGTTLLEFFSDWDPELDKIKEELIIETD
jgi:branched-subunit amino acid transport protein